MISLGILEKKSLLQGYVFRMPKAYPVYDLEYSENVDTISNWIFIIIQMFIQLEETVCTDTTIKITLWLQRTSQLENILGEKNDIWNVNVEDEYHEEKISERIIPRKIVN